MRIAILSASMLVSSWANAAIPIEGPYGSVFGGYSFIPDNVRKFYFGNVYTRPHYNSGYHVGARMGFQSNPLRYEGEISFINAQLNHFNLNYIRRNQVSGQTSALLGMANLYYDFPEMVPCIAPFIGAGIGYGWMRAQLNYNPLFAYSFGYPAFSPVYSPFTFNRTNFTGSSGVFAYQGTAGFSFNFSESYSVNIAYRYIGTSRAPQLGKTLQSQLASVGIVYRFNEYVYK